MGRPVLEGEARRVRVVVFGNAGRHEGEELSNLDGASTTVLWSIFARHRLRDRRPYDLGLTVGDNFPPVGVETTEQHRQRWWPYQRLGVPFFPTLGDDDYAGVPGPRLNSPQLSGTFRDLMEHP